MSEQNELTQQEQKDKKQHWLHYSFSQRQKRSLVVLAVFIILGLFSSLMYYRTGGDYTDVTDQIVETIEQQ